VVADVFTALSRLGDVPASVCFAAATLAAVTDSPAAPVWMTRVSRLAWRHGAKGFASLFGQLAK
jgi:hypothetical protein